MGDLAQHGGLPPLDQARPLWETLWHLDVHHSTAIEGNTLVLREVEALLDQGKAVGAKELKDYMEVLGYAEAATWVYRQAGSGRDWEHDQTVTLTEIRELHQRVMTHVWSVSPHPAAFDAEKPGSFRRHEIAAFPGGMKPPTFPLVPAMLGAWIDPVNDAGAQIRNGRVPWTDCPALLAGFHAEFERIHPFLDGNGRTGRAVLNLILVRLGIPPVVILKTQRRRYLTALGTADAGEPGPLAELLARAAIASLTTLLPTIADAADLVPLSSLADHSLSLAALRQAVARGRLAATLDTRGQWRSTRGQWRSTRQAVDSYKTTRYRRT
jgi:hypothetical protein